MNTRITTLLTAAVMLSMGFVSCDDDDKIDPNTKNQYIDMVTYEGVGIDGATFTFQQLNDSPVITLTSSQTMNTIDFKPQSRIVISYTTQSNEHYVSGPINITGAMNTIGGGDAPENGDATTTNNWASDPIDMYQLWRTGDYLNLYFAGALGDHDANVHFYLDESTIDDETPSLHLTYGPYVGITNQTYLFYASYDISEIWKKDTCKGLKVYYKDLGTTDGYTLISKTDSSIRPQ